MERLLFLILFVAVSTSVFSITGGKDYIITSECCMFFDKVEQRYSAIIGIKPCGEKVRFHQSKVIQYCKNGEVYEKAPLIKNNKKSDIYVFMRVVCRRNEMTLYEHKKNNFFNKKKPNFYVFRKNQFVVELCCHRDASLIADFAFPEKLLQ